MIEITTEIRAIIDKAAADLTLAGDEYIDPADGLIHCKKCGGNRQTVVPNFGKPGYFMPRCICPVRPKQSASARRPRNRGTAWRVSSAGGRRGFKTAICMTIPLPTITDKTR